MRYNLHLGANDCYELYRIENGAETLLGSDRGEPEDNSFLRDWAWVPAELNWLAGKVTELEREMRAVKAAGQMGFAAAEAESEHLRAALQDIVARCEERDKGEGFYVEPGPLAWALHRVAKQALADTEETP